MEEPRAVPTEFSLVQIYPNPFNLTATVQFRMSKAAYVNIKVYDVLGREIQTLLSGYTPPGLHNLKFNMAGGMASGIYFCRMVAGGFSQTKAINLMR